MRGQQVRLCVAAIAYLVSVGVSSAAAQTQTKSTEVKKFVVVSVDGNKVVATTEQGAKEYTVPDDFRFNIAGKPLSVHELKPGMTGTATITTTTTTKPVYVTTVKNGEVVQASGSSLLVRTAEGYKQFSPGDVEKRGVTIMKDGKAADFSDLHQGDRLSATIVTEGPPHILTQREVQATVSGAPAPTARAVPPPPAGKPPAATATGGEASSSARKLPKTASPLPLVGIVGVLSLFAAVILTVVRRRRTS